MEKIDGRQLARYKVAKANCHPACPESFFALFLRAMKNDFQKDTRQAGMTTQVSRLRKFALN